MNTAMKAIGLGGLLAIIGVYACADGQGGGGQPVVGSIDQQLAETTIRLENFTRATLPASVAGPTGTNGRLARLTDESRGIWFDNGTTWVSLTGEVFNVKDFGATGNATIGGDAGACPGDEVGIQAAINAAAAKGSGKVYLPRGVYHLCGPVSITSSNITLSGDGDASALYIDNWMALSSPSSGYITVDGTATDATQGVHIHDLRIVGTNDSQHPTTGKEFAILIGGNNTVRSSGVSRVHVVGAGGTAIVFAGGTASPESAQSRNNYAIDNTIENTATFGIESLANIGWGGQLDTIVCGNHIMDTAIAIHWTASESLICNNAITRTWGIEIEGDASQTGWTLLTNNLITASGLHADGTVGPSIKLNRTTPAHHVKISNNAIQKSYGPGIWASGGVTDIVVSNNNVDDFGYGSNGSPHTFADPLLFWNGIHISNVVNARIVDNHVVCRSGAPELDKCDHGIFMAGASAANVWSDGNTTLGVSTDPIVQNASTGKEKAGTNVWFGRNVDLNTGTVAPFYSASLQPTMPLLPLSTDDAGAGSVISSIAGSDSWTFFPAGATTIAGLDGGVEGRTVTLVFQGQPTTILDAPPFDLDGNFVSTAGGADTLVLMWTGVLWVEISRSHN